MKAESELISLYDYLGHAGGRELGKQIADFCTMEGYAHNIRYVSNAKYVGPVCLYPRIAFERFFLYKKFIEKYSHIYTKKL